MDRLDETVRAGVGWRPGIIGRARIRLGERSSEAYPIREAEPVITPNIDEEARFDLAGFVKEHGVKALVSVPIVLPGGKADGLLQVDATEPRDLLDPSDDLGFVRDQA